MFLYVTNSKYLLTPKYLTNEQMKMEGCNNYSLFELVDMNEDVTGYKQQSEGTLGLKGRRKNKNADHFSCLCGGNAYKQAETVNSNGKKVQMYVCNKCKKVYKKIK